MSRKLDFFFVEEFLHLTDTTNNNQADHNTGDTKYHSLRTHIFFNSFFDFSTGLANSFPSFIYSRIQKTSKRLCPC